LEESNEADQGGYEVSTPERSSANLLTRKTDPADVERLSQKLQDTLRRFLRPRSYRGRVNRRPCAQMSCGVRSQPRLRRCQDLTQRYWLMGQPLDICRAEACQEGKPVELRVRQETRQMRPPIKSRASICRARFGADEEVCHPRFKNQNACASTCRPCRRHRASEASPSSLPASRKSPLRWSGVDRRSKPHSQAPCA
jgi:hypothetical protein